MKNNDPALMTEDERDLIKGTTKEAFRLIEAAKIQLMRYRPFYGTLLSNMPVYADTRWLPTIATNGRDIIFNPEFIAGFCDERKANVAQRISQMNVSAKKKKKIQKSIDVFYKRKTLKEVIFFLEHEVRHVICDHLSRGKGYDPVMFNIAADYYINGDLIQTHAESCAMSRNPWFKKGQDTFEEGKEFESFAQIYINHKYEGWTAEQIYTDLMSKNKDTKGKMSNDFHMGAGDGTPTNQKSDGPKGESGHGAGTPSSGGGEQGDSDDDYVTNNEVGKALGIDSSVEPRLTEDQKHSNDESMKRAIVNATTAAGAGAPPEARELVKTLTKPKINYVEYLIKRLSSMRRTKITYQKPHRRSGSLTRVLRARGAIKNTQRIVLPSKSKRKTIRVAIGIDVSGSFTDALLNKVWSEVSGFGSQFDEFEITLFCWSTFAANPQKYDRKNIKELVKYKITTSGGTDCHCAFKFVDSEIKDCDQIIIFTDGYFGSVKEGVDDKGKKWSQKYKNTLWVIFNNDSWQAPFGKALNFDRYAK